MESFDSVEVFTHPNYDGFIGYDYALVKLSGRSSITPVPMDTTGKSETYTTDTELTAIGKSTLDLYNRIGNIDRIVLVIWLNLFSRQHFILFIITLNSNNVIMINHQCIADLLLIFQYS